MGNFLSSRWEDDDHVVALLRRKNLETQPGMLWRQESYSQKKNHYRHQIPIVLESWS